MTHSPEILAAVADAIEKAQCPDREGPYGLYDYSGYPGDGPPHVVRDFRDIASPSYGSVVFRSMGPGEASARYERLTREHVAGAAIDAVLPFTVAPGLVSVRPWPGDTLDQIMSILSSIEYIAHNDIKADGMKSIHDFARTAQSLEPRVRAILEETCPGHVASAADPKVCARCGVHIDSFRPDEGDE